MKDLPVINIDTASVKPGQVIEIIAEPDEVRWLTFVAWMQRVLAVLGAVCLVGLLSAAAGYWWARYGEPEWMRKPVAETPCGSCRLGAPK